MRLPRQISGNPDRKLPSSSSRGVWGTTSEDLLDSFWCAGQGLVYSFISQRNFRIHILVTFLVFTIGLWLHLNNISLAVLVLTVTVVLVLELLNTAIEAVVDLAVGRRFHPLAKIAKDCAAAAVLIAAGSSIAVALLLLLPPLLIHIGF